MRGTLALLAIALCSSPLFAGTWLVDDDGGPGVDFLDIPPAIAAAAPGDVVLVMPGTYSGFVLAKRLSIVGAGSGTRTVVGDIELTALVEGEVAAVCDMVLNGHLLFTGNFAATIADRMTLPSGALVVNGSWDVRASNLSIQAPSAPPGTGTGGHALGIGAGRLELVDSTLRAGDGGDCVAAGCSFAGTGGQAVFMSNGAQLHAYGSSLLGGAGGDANDPDPFEEASAGPGGPGGWVQGFAQFCGEASDLIDGGPAGTGEAPASAGPGLFGGPFSILRVSGVTVDGIVTTGGLLQPVTPDPTLRAIGIPLAGQVTQFEVRAGTGASVELLLGRMPKLGQVPTGPLEGELLIVPLRVIPLGSVGASGVVSSDFKTPAHVSTGFVYFAQARATLNGTTLYTNSVPLVVR